MFNFKQKNTVIYVIPNHTETYAMYGPFYDLICSAIAKVLLSLGVIDLII